MRRIFKKKHMLTIINPLMTDAKFDQKEKQIGQV